MTSNKMNEQLISSDELAVNYNFQPSSSNSAHGNLTALPSCNLQSSPQDSPPASSPEPWSNLLVIKQLVVEPFILLYMIGYSLSGMAVFQLVQDKLCRVDYDQTSKFCISINSENFDHGGEGIKSSIISSGAYITLYRTLLATLPCMIWVVFLGPWSDTYVSGRKLIMLAGGIAASIESIVLIIFASMFHSCKFIFLFDEKFNFCFVAAYLVLLAFIPSSLSGGIIAILMAVNAYVTATSDAETRSTRFAIMEICFWIGK